LKKALGGPKLTNGREKYEKDLCCMYRSVHHLCHCFSLCTGSAPRRDGNAGMLPKVHLQLNLQGPALPRILRLAISCHQGGKSNYFATLLPVS